MKRLTRAATSGEGGRAAQRHLFPRNRVQFIDRSRLQVPRDDRPSQGGEVGEQRFGHVKRLWIQAARQKYQRRLQEWSR